MNESVELVPNQREKARPFFETPEAYQEFCTSFFEEVRQDLERFREARRQSEECAKRHWMR